MSPGALIAVIAVGAALCWLVAYLEEIANGTPEERKAYRDKRAKEDMEAMLREANQEVADRPRVRAGTTFFNRENT